MKTLFQILSIVGFACLLAYAIQMQENTERNKLSGIYQHESPNYRALLTFDGNHKRFYYGFFHDTSSVCTLEKGYYLYKENSLILDYDRTGLENDTMFYELEENGVLFIGGVEYIKGM